MKQDGVAIARDFTVVRNTYFHCAKQSALAVCNYSGKAGI